MLLLNNLYRIVSHSLKFGYNIDSWWLSVVSGVNQVNLLKSIFLILGPLKRLFRFEYGNFMSKKKKRERESSRMANKHAKFVCIAVIMIGWTFDHSRFFDCFTSFFFFSVNQSRTYSILNYCCQFRFCEKKKLNLTR